MQSDLKSFRCCLAISTCYKTSSSVSSVSSVSSEVNSPECCLKAIPHRPWFKNGSGEDADPPSRHSRSTPIILLCILQIDSLRSPFGLPEAVFLRSDSASSRRSCFFVGGSSCLKNPLSFSACCKTSFSTPCSLTRSLPLISPFGPTFGCSISKAPPFRLWLIMLDSPPSGLFVDVFDLFVAFFHFFLCVLGRRSYRKLR